MSGRAPLQWYYFTVNETILLSNWPIHFAGAALLCYNHGIVPVEISIQESNAGGAGTFSPVIMTVPGQTNQMDIQCVAKSTVLICFRSVLEFVQITVAPRCAEGIYCSLFQYIPYPREAPAPAGY